MAPFVTQRKKCFQLPCLNFPLSQECSKERGIEDSPFASSNDDDDDQWGDDDWAESSDDEKEQKPEFANAGAGPQEEVVVDVEVPDFVVSLSLASVLKFVESTFH